jgi:hypothetical protein
VGIVFNRLSSGLRQPERKTNKSLAFLFSYTLSALSYFLLCPWKVHKFCTILKVKVFLLFSIHLRGNVEAVCTVCLESDMICRLQYSWLSVFVCCFLQRRIPSHSIMSVGIRLHKCIFTQTQRLHDTCISKSDSLYRVYPFLWIERSTVHCKHDSWYVSFHPPVSQKALFNVVALESDVWWQGGVRMERKI